MSGQPPKRPSARPSARPALPATSRSASVPPKAADKPEARVSPPQKSEPPRAQSPARSAGTSDGAGASTARISARRSNPPVVAAPERSARPLPHGAKPSKPKAQTVNRARPMPAKVAPQPKPVHDARSPASSAQKPQRADTKPKRAQQLIAQPLPIGVPPLPERPSREDGDVFSAVEAESGALSGLAGLAERAALPESDAGIGARLLLGSGADRRAQEAFAKGSQSLLSSDYYVRQYGAHGLRNLSAEVDEYGLDPHAEERARPWLEMLSTRYFRLDLEGAQRVPARGRALLVCNRSGAVPWDGLMLRTALRMQRPELPPLRWLSEDSVIHYPFLGTFMNRLGAVRACPENAERMLSQDRLVAAFPEGAQGSQKLYKDRYRLQRFGRGGYVKLALKLGVPILPTAIIGAEEVNPLLGRVSLFGRRSRLGGDGNDFLPITPTFPWLGPLGLLPAPVKWRVIVGEPVDLSAYGPEAAEDALLVHRLNEQIRSILQTLIDQAQSSRRSVLFG